jgi:hypothetical protein
MIPTDIPGPVGIADVITGVRYGLAFDAKGRHRSIKRQTSKCRQVLERIPAANGYRPRRDGAVTLSLFHRAMEQRWRELSWMVQGACLRCPLYARKQCPGGSTEGLAARQWAGGGVYRP